MQSGFGCRGCGSRKGELILDFGEVPLANAFIDPDNSSPSDQFRAPLSLVICLDCGLLQIKDEVPRDELFTDYVWMTSASAAALEHAAQLSRKLKDRFGNSVSSREIPFLVEIASNDGTFLDAFQRKGFEVLGVDPSNFADDATARGLTSIRAFFGESVAKRIVAEKGEADLIVARNVLGHSSELRDLVQGLKVLLAKGGTLVLEMPYAYMMRTEVQYDYIFHEHLSYFTVGSLHNLMAQFDFRIVDIDYVHMNGGSLLCELAHAEDTRQSVDGTSLAFERFIRLNVPSGWESYAASVERQRSELLGCLRELRRDGKRIAAYGAAARFMTLLNFCQIGTDMIDAVGDVNERKQSMLCPGVRIPVVSPSALVAMAPDYILIGAANFKDEIINSLRDKYGYRGRFICPSPLPAIIE